MRGSYGMSSLPRIRQTAAIVHKLKLTPGPNSLRVIRDVQGKEIRVPHDENTRIDRPAHVGDCIQSWLDHHGHAVLIRSLDGSGR